MSQSTAMLGPEIGDALSDLKQDISKHITALIDERLVPSIAASHEWKTLERFCPPIKELVFGVSTSGWNDGDPEYTLAVPLFKEMYENSLNSIEESYRGSDRNWKSASFGIESEEDKKVLAVLKELSIEDAYSFVDEYNFLVKEIFKTLSDYCYYTGQLIRIHVAPDKA